MKKLNSFDNDNKLGSKIFWILLLVYLLFMGNVAEQNDHPFYSIDGEIRFLVTKNIVENKRISINDEGKQSIYGIAPSLLAIPFYLLGGLIDKIFVEDKNKLLFVSLLNPIFTALACFVFWKCLKLIGYKPKPSLYTSLILGLTSPLWVYTKMFFCEPLVTLLLLLLVFYSLKPRYWGKNKHFLHVGYAGISTGILGLSKPEFFILAPIVATWLYFCGRNIFTKQKILWTLSSPTLYLSIVFIFTLLLAYHNYLRFGSWKLVACHEFNYFDTPLILGLTGLLFSPGKSIFLFFPALIISLFGFKKFVSRNSRITIFFVAITFPFIILYSMWFMWYGGTCWGPRFLVPFFPIMLIPATGVIENFHGITKTLKTITLLLISLGLFIQLPSILYHPHMGLMHLNENQLLDNKIYFSWKGSGILGAWHALGKYDWDLYWFSFNQVDILFLQIISLVILFKWVVYPLITNNTSIKFKKSLIIMFVALILTFYVLNHLKIPPQRGVHVKYYNKNNQESPAFEGIRSTISLKNLDLTKRIPGNNGYLSIWKGILSVNKKGKYGFYIHSDGHDRVYLNKTLLIKNIKPGVKNVNSSIVYTNLNPGFYGLIIHHENNAPIETIILKWIPPGVSKLQNIPVTQLHPDNNSAIKETMYKRNIYLTLILAAMVMGIILVL